MIKGNLSEYDNGNCAGEQGEAESMDRREFLRRAGRACLAAWGGSLFLPAGCRRRNEKKIVIYTALDEVFSRKIFEEYEARASTRVLAVFDTEANKSVGLAARLLQESHDPRCDLFWNNEVLNTVLLAEAGVLEPVRMTREVTDLRGKKWRAADGSWYGFAARGRVVLHRPGLEDFAGKPLETWPETASRNRGLRFTLAYPFAGTTATHLAILSAEKGSSFIRRWLKKLGAAENVAFVSGNKQVAQAVARGEADLGLTDSDDAVIEIRAGAEVKIAPCISFAEDPGALLIPNTLAAVRGRPHPEQALALAEFLLSAEIEEKLASGPSAQIPLAPHLNAPEILAPLTGYPAGFLDVDWSSAAGRLEEAISFARELLG